MFFKYCKKKHGEETLFSRAHEERTISARSRANVVQRARTKADLEGSNTLRKCYTAEAFHYRFAIVNA